MNPKLTVTADEMNARTRLRTTGRCGHWVCQNPDGTWGHWAAYDSEICPSRLPLRPETIMEAKVKDA